MSLVQEPCFARYFPQLISSVWVPIPGILTLAALGLLAWRGPAWISPEHISRIGLSLLFLFVGYSLVRRPLTSLLRPVELKVLAFIFLLVVICVAKATYSIGPSGELYKGHISRTLEVGSRGDSRIPYHVVQLIGLRLHAYSESAGKLFGFWNFSDRGPLASLAASSMVLCGDVKLSTSMPDDTWTVFDPQGFASYRIAMIVLAAGSLFVLFGLAQLFLDDRWAMLAFLCVVGAPFTLHEIFFTWPKILAADFVLLGAYAVLRRRFFLAGLMVGLGYLCHPSALIFFPAVLV